MPEQVPSKIGRYRIVGVVGQWTAFPWVMGWLYHGCDDTIGRDVWIKTLAPTAVDSASGCPFVLSVAQARAPFEREAKIGAFLRHPNIITIIESGEDRGIPFLVLEGLEGQSLLEAMKAGISLRAGLPVIQQVLDALRHMHARNVVHRDIGPANIFVCSDGRAKVINLFIARIEDPAAVGDGQTEGTPPYMSPEQLMGETLDGRSDIFSVGSVLYEMVTGKKPFHGDTPVATLFTILNEPQVMASIPDGPEWKRLRGVVTRALQKNREDRYPDALAMRKDLELALKELGDSADWTPPPSH